MRASPNVSLPSICTNASTSRAVFVVVFFLCCSAPSYSFCVVVIILSLRRRCYFKADSPPLVVPFFSRVELGQVSIVACVVRRNTATHLLRLSPRCKGGGGASVPAVGGARCVDVGRRHRCVARLQVQPARRGAHVQARLRARSRSRRRFVGCLDRCMLRCFRESGISHTCCSSCCVCVRARKEPIKAAAYHTLALANHWQPGSH